MTSTSPLDRTLELPALDPEQAVGTRRTDPLRRQREHRVLVLNLWCAVLGSTPELVPLLGAAVQRPARLTRAASVLAADLAAMAAGVNQVDLADRRRFFADVRDQMPQMALRPSTRAARLFIDVLAQVDDPGMVHRRMCTRYRPVAQICGVVRALRTLADEAVAAGWYPDEGSLLARLRANEPEADQPEADQPGADQCSTNQLALSGQ